MKAKLWRYCAILSVLLCTLVPSLASAFPCCSTPAPQQITTNYQINVSSLQTTLSLGTDDPTRSIQQAFASLQWGTGSNRKWVYGGTTTATTCGTAPANTNVIIGSTSCGPISCSNRATNVVSCGNGAKIWTVYKGTGTTWKVTAESGSQSEISGSVLGAALRLLGALSTNATNCLSSANANEETFIRSRQAFCNVEIQQVTVAAGVQLPYITGNSAAGKTPTAATWGSSFNAQNYTGIGGYDAARGIVRTSTFTPPYYVDTQRQGVLYSRPEDPPLSPFPAAVKFFDTVSDTVYATPAVTYRRPSFTYDPTRRKWWMFTHNSSYDDEVLFWSSTNLSSWTNHGTLKMTAFDPTYDPGAPPAGTSIPTMCDKTSASHVLIPIKTRHPVTPIYMPVRDRIEVVFVNYTGSIITDEAKTTGHRVAGTMGITFIEAGNPDQTSMDMCPMTGPAVKWVGGTHGRFWAGITDTTPIIASPPAISCAKDSCDIEAHGGGWLPPFQYGFPHHNYSCVGVVTEVIGTTRDLVAFSLSIGGSPSLGVQSEPASGLMRDSNGGLPGPYDGGSTTMVPSTNWYVNAPKHPGGQSDWPVSGSNSGYNALDGKHIFAVRGTDDKVYFNSLDSDRMTYGASCSSVVDSKNWSGWTPFLLNGSTQMTTQTGPQIRYRPESNDWMLWIATGNQ